MDTEIKDLLVEMALLLSKFYDDLSALKFDLPATISLSDYHTNQRPKELMLEILCDAAIDRDMLIYLVQYLCDRHVESTAAEETLLVLARYIKVTKLRTERRSTGDDVATDDPSYRLLEKLGNTSVEAAQKARILADFTDDLSNLDDLDYLMIEFGGAFAAADKEHLMYALFKSITGYAIGSLYNLEDPLSREQRLAIIRQIEQHLVALWRHASMSIECAALDLNNSEETALGQSDITLLIRTVLQCKLEHYRPGILLEQFRVRVLNFKIEAARNRNSRSVLKDNKLHEVIRDLACNIEEICTLLNQCVSARLVGSADIIRQHFPIKSPEASKVAMRSIYRRKENGWPGNAFWKAKLNTTNENIV